jgi:hypothetical protein
VSWETERTDSYNRVHWLVIDRIGTGASEAALEDQGFFRHSEPSGRIDVERAGNAFVAQSRGVREFTLLLSPDALDFSKPVTVSVNGHGLFAGIVKKDVGVLTKWASRDDDRTMLYGAELKIGAVVIGVPKVPRVPQVREVPGVLGVLKRLAITRWRYAEGQPVGCRLSRVLDRPSIRSRLFDPLPGQVMIGTPGLPRRLRPLVDPAKVVFGVDRFVYMNDGERSALLRRRIARARKEL